MKRQRAKQRPLYRYDVYRGRRRGQARLIGAAGCAVFGLLLVLIRSLGIRFSGFLLLGLAALLVLSWLLDRLAAGNHRWRLIHRGFYGCLTVGLAALLGLEVFIINRGRSDMTPLPADAVIVLGAGVNGTEPSLSLRTRLDKAVDYLERWPDIPAVLTGGTGYGEEISEARAMYEYLQYNGIPEDKLLIEDQSSDTVQNIEFSRTVIDRQEYNKAQAARAHLMEFYRERPDGDTIRIGILTSNYHVFRAEAIARRQEIEPVGVAAACDPVLAVHLRLREAFAVLKDKFMGRL